jgi:hypothetical protein
MAIIAFPSITAETQNFGINYNTQVSVGPLSGSTQSVELPGARWKGNVGYRDMTKAEAALLQAFTLELRGTAGRFFYGDAAATSPQLAVTGSPTVLASSTNRIIKITLGSTIALSPGDYIQIGTDDQRELKMVISSTNTGGNNFDVGIEPALRRTDYLSKPVVYSNPKGVFMLSSDVQGMWGVRSKALLSDMSLEFIEVFQ